MPDLKRVRPTGGESRRRARGEGLRRRRAHRLERPVRRLQRRRPRLLEGGGASIPGARGSALAAAGLTVLVAAGCGGGRLSHGSFVKRADAVCSAYRAQTSRVATPRSYDAIVRWGRRTLPLYVAALRKLEALRPPKDDEAAVRSWLAADRRVERAVRDLVVAAQKRDFPSVTAAASRAQLAGSESRSRATSLGMQVCGTVAVSGR